MERRLTGFVLKLENNSQFYPNLDHIVADRKRIAAMHSTRTFFCFADIGAVGSACFLSDQVCNWLQGFGGWGEEQTLW